MKINRWPIEDLESVECCPACGGVARTLLYGRLTDRVFRIADGEWAVYRCSTCASGYLDPRPTSASVGRAYAGYYTHNTEDHPIVRRKGHVRSFLHELVNGYENKRYGLKRTPARSWGRWLLPLMPSLRSAADAECRHLPPLPAGGGRLLDVGCGNGGFLALAEQAGWRADGIDFDAAAIAVAKSRGLNARCGGIDLLGADSDCYDVITLCHVIEHVHEPTELLALLYKMLKPGGMLWLETPNLESLGAKRYERNWRGLEPPRHLVLFSRNALRDVLRKVGFSHFRQYWRGMTVFNIFAASEAIAAGEDVSSATRDGRVTVSDCRAEMHEMFSPPVREFLTYTVRK